MWMRWAAWGITYMLGSKMIIGLLPAAPWWICIPLLMLWAETAWRTIELLSSL